MANVWSLRYELHFTITFTHCSGCLFFFPFFFWFCLHFHYFLSVTIWCLWIIIAGYCVWSVVFWSVIVSDCFAIKMGKLNESFIYDSNLFQIVSSCVLRQFEWRRTDDYILNGSKLNWKTKLKWNENWSCSLFNQHNKCQAVMWTWCTKKISTIPYCWWKKEDNNLAISELDRKSMFVGDSAYECDEHVCVCVPLRLKPLQSQYDKT